MALGLVTGVAAFAIATSLFLWMSPTILGLVLAIPISWASGQLGLGLALKRLGLLMTPEEREPRPSRAGRALSRRNAESGLDDADALTALHADPALARAHAAMLPEATPRPRGSIDPDRALAQAKVVEAERIDEARAWLSPRERMALLHDRALLDRLGRLGS